MPLCLSSVLTYLWDILWGLSKSISSCFLCPQRRRSTSHLPIWGSDLLLGFRSSGQSFRPVGLLSSLPLESLPHCPAPHPHHVHSGLHCFTTLTFVCYFSWKTEPMREQTVSVNLLIFGFSESGRYRPYIFHYNPEEAHSLTLEICLPVLTFHLHLELGNMIQVTFWMFVLEALMKRSLERTQVCGYSN